ncbi:hypothetical protein D5400_14205 [Georhizobium profundi]|uniref:Uncharacterized protein n=1 Tax=Georhizobium profundi TaxID=2341112 RepID=A0A3Q8XRQ7_9HYPH|nr:hypothetical protein [Georhizobium profundi]AZN72276.1 hypothetical protein D5400_14205 [Georhizobium profundi]
MSELTKAPFSDAWFHRLKAAQRDLIKRCGGIDRASEVTSVSRSQVGRWNNAGDPDLVTIPALLMLEAECGQPLITSVLAGIGGRRLADPDELDAGGASSCALSAHAETISRAGELMQVGARALADGKLTPAEATEMDRAAASMENSVADLRTVLSRAKVLRVVGDER